MIVCGLEEGHEKIRKRICYLKNKDEYLTRRMVAYNANKEKHQAYMKMYSKKFRIKVRSIILWHFDYHCSRCGYNEDSRALQLDHNFGGGSQEQRKIGPIAAYYYDKPALLFEKFTLLCANCNMIKRIENNELGRRFLPR